MNGVFVGRFQPFHKGHLSAIESVVDRVDKLFLFIGSSESSRIVENPLTLDERKEMLNRVLDASLSEWKDKIVVKDVPDLGNDIKWSGYILDKVGSKDVTVFSSSPWVNRCFSKQGIKIEIVPMIDRDNFEASKIRERVNSNNPWEQFVPLEVSKYLREIGFENIVKNICSQ